VPWISILLYRIEHNLLAASSNALHDDESGGGVIVHKVLEPRFILPDDLGYRCIRCARCCSDFWEIPIDQATYDQLKERDLAAIKPSLERISPVMRSVIDRDRWVMRRSDLQCCLLSLQHECLLHSHFGYEAKPQGCRDFPLRFVVTPDGIYVGLSFACSSVVRSEGKKGIIAEDDLRAAFQQSQNTATLYHEIEFSKTVSVPWDLYVKIEQELVRLLSVDVYPLDVRLIGGGIYLDLLERFIHEACKQHGYGIDRAVETFIRDMGQQRYQRIITMAGKARNSPMLKRMFVGLVIAYRNSAEKRRGRMRDIGFVLFHYLKHWLMIGKVSLLPIAGGFAYDQLRHVRFDISDPFFEFQLRRFFLHMIFRKDLVTHRDLLSGYRFMLLYYALIRWYAVGLACTRNADEVARTDLTEAIALVERYYVFHPVFDHLFARNPLFHRIVEKFLQSKAYAPTIVRPAVKP
jgi:hypothetical protein